MKRPPEGIVARAGWPGVGIWFGDDGGCVCNNALGQIGAFRFHTNAFAPEEVDRLAAELRQLSGLPWRRYLQNGIYPILTLGNGDGTQNNKGQGNLAKWSELIRPYVPPMLGYKLRVDSCGDAWSGLEPPRRGSGRRRRPSRRPGPYVPASHEDCLIYHLGVAGAGNFVAHGILVGDVHADGGGEPRGLGRVGPTADRPGRVAAGALRTLAPDSPPLRRIGSMACRSSGVRGTPRPVGRCLSPRSQPFPNSTQEIPS